VAPTPHTRLGFRVSADVEESALLLRCPAAESAVGMARARLDRSAGVGVPAHVTITYPFKPPALLSDADHRLLERVLTERSSLSLTCARTAWFGDAVVFVELANPAAVLALTEAVLAAFPEFPPYAGAFAEVVPHLTIGHDHDPATLRTAEEEVRSRLPFTQVVSEVELWAGPPLSSGRGPWRRVRSYGLG
jgi:2'-5' RNA ligase